MVFLVLIMMALLTAAVMLLGSRTNETATGKGDGQADAGHTGGDPQSVPTTLEGALVAQLISGEISHLQYHNAQARLAARDDERNPMSAPGNDRPDACA